MAAVAVDVTVRVIVFALQQTLTLRLIIHAGAPLRWRREQETKHGSHAPLTTGAVNPTEAGLPFPVGHIRRLLKKCNQTPRAVEPDAHRNLFTRRTYDAEGIHNDIRRIADNVNTRYCYASATRPPAEPEPRTEKILRGSSVFEIFDMRTGRRYPVDLRTWEVHQAERERPV